MNESITILKNLDLTNNNLKKETNSNNFSYFLSEI